MLQPKKEGNGKQRLETKKVSGSRLKSLRLPGAPRAVPQVNVKDDAVMPVTPKDDFFVCLADQMDELDCLEAMFSCDELFLDEACDLARRFNASSLKHASVPSLWTPPSLTILFSFQSKDTNHLPALQLSVTMPTLYPLYQQAQVSLNFFQSKAPQHAFVLSISSPYEAPLQFLRAQVRADCENHKGEVAVLRLSELIREGLFLFEPQSLEKFAKERLNNSQVNSPPASETSPVPENLEKTKNDELITVLPTVAAVDLQDEDDDHDNDLGTSKTHIRVGLVGLPNVGKSSLFNAISGLSVPAANYPFCTIDPHTAVVEVDDPRLTKLHSVTGVHFVTPPSLTIIDIAGLVRGAAEGAGLGNAFLHHISTVHVILHVVRAFPDPEIQHVDGDMNPARDLETITIELVKKDAEAMEKRIARVVRKLEHAGRSAASARMQEELQTLRTALAWLQERRSLRHRAWTAREAAFLRTLQLWTSKPVVILANLSAADFLDQSNCPALGEVKQWAARFSPDATVLPVSAPFEESLRAEQAQEQKKETQEKQSGQALEMLLAPTSGSSPLPGSSSNYPNTKACTFLAAQGVEFGWERYAFRMQGSHLRRLGFGRLDVRDPHSATVEQLGEDDGSDPLVEDGATPLGGKEGAATLLADADLHVSLKSLVFAPVKAPHAPFLLLQHCDRKVSLPALAAATGYPGGVRPMQVPDAEAVTGYKVGGISPFGCLTNLPVFIEQSALELPWVWVGGGQRGLSVSLRTSDLQRLTKARAVSVGVDVKRVAAPVSEIREPTVKISVRY